MRAAHCCVAFIRLASGRGLRLSPPRIRELAGCPGEGSVTEAFSMALLGERDWYLPWWLAWLPGSSDSHHHAIVVAGHG